MGCLLCPGCLFEGHPRDHAQWMDAGSRNGNRSSLEKGYIT
jgi:hypothetical protein